MLRLYNQSDKTIDNNKLSSWSNFLVCTDQDAFGFFVIGMDTETCVLGHGITARIFCYLFIKQHWFFALTETFFCIWEILRIYYLFVLYGIVIKNQTMVTVIADVVSIWARNVRLLEEYNYDPLEVLSFKRVGSRLSNG